MYHFLYSKKTFCTTWVSSCENDLLYTACVNKLAQSILKHWTLGLFPWNIENLFHQTRYCSRSLICWYVHYWRKHSCRIAMISKLLFQCKRVSWYELRFRNQIGLFILLDMDKKYLCSKQMVLHSHAICSKRLIFLSSWILYHTCGSFLLIGSCLCSAGVLEGPWVLEAHGHGRRMWKLLWRRPRASSAVTMWWWMEGGAKE